MTDDARRSRFAWLRLNAYGVLIAGLLLLAAFDITNPEQSDIAQIVGRAPVLQPAWSVGYVVAALFILHGFIRSQTWSEIIGLGLLGIALTVQTVAVADLLGWGSPGAVRGYVVWALVVMVVWLRVSVLVSKEGLTVTIPGRETTP